MEECAIGKLTLDDWKNIATIVAALIALVVYITNSAQQHRQRHIENFSRLIQAHRQLFKSDLFKKHWREFETGSFKRKPEDEEINAQFSQVLGEIEYYAILQRANIIPRKLNTYMFGWWAQRIQPCLTSEERNNIYWQVAIKFIDQMKQEGDDFHKKTKDGFDEYFEKDFFR